jgi:CheY-like chemotaxis protein
MREPLLVLLVEDDDADATCTVRALRASSSAIRVQRVLDCEEALVWLRKSDDDQRRLVLLDWHLPRMSGQQMLCVMRKEPKLSDIPVFILSGDESEEALNDSYGLGARAFVQKPKSPQGYSELVRELVKFWEASELN